MLYAYIYAFRFTFLEVVILVLIVPVIAQFFGYLEAAEPQGLSKELIDVLPKQEWKSAADSEHDCIICMEPFKLGENYTALPCDSRHYFHTECILNWLSRSDKCPMCKASVKKIHHNKPRFIPIGTMITV